MPNCNYRKVSFYFIFGALLLGGKFTYPHFHGHPLILSQAYKLSGSFTAHGEYAGSRWQQSEDKQFSLGSQAGNDRNTGKFASAAFTAPAVLNFFVSGCPTIPGIALYLEKNDGARLNLGVRTDPATIWHDYYWRIPRSWRGRQVRLVADDESTSFGGWIGLTLPRGQSETEFLAQVFLRAWFVFSTILFEAIAFILPGFAIALLLASRQSLDGFRFVSSVLIGSAVAGYLAFWPYLLGPSFGKAFAIAIYAVVLLVICCLAYKKPIQKEPVRCLLVCVGLMVLLTTFYSAIGFLYDNSPDPGVQAEQRFAWDMPVDNILPNMLANDLYFSKPFRPFFFIDWKSSDRPPLQTGIVLLQRPMWRLTQDAWDYQILGTLLQSMWIVSLWLLLRCLHTTARVGFIVLMFCIFSGFSVLHTFFVWPKLMAAAFFIIAVALLRFPQGGIEDCEFIDTTLAGAAIGLAMLSHGGIAFSVIAFAIVLSIGRRLPRLRTSIAGIVAMILLVIPWTMYQKFYDPPGDRLLKWHLAGAMYRDSRSFGRTLIDAYSKVPFSEIVDNKIANLRTLVGPGPEAELERARQTGASRSKVLLHWYKVGTFFFFFQMLGVLNFGFLSFLMARLRSGRRETTALVSELQRLYILAAVSLLVWCALIYLPGTNVIHVGSYGTVLLLFTTLGASLASFSPRLAYGLLIIQALFLFPLFAITDAFQKSRPGTVFANGADPAMAAFGVVSVVLLIMLSGYAFAAGDCLIGRKEQAGFLAARAPGSHVT